MLIPNRSLLNLQRRRNSLPIWSCSVWGLPCPPDYSNGGALLPHLFTLTPAPRYRASKGGIFSVALSVNRPWRRLPGRYPAHCSAEFGLSSLITWRDKSGRPVQLPTYWLYSMS